MPKQGHPEIVRPQGSANDLRCLVNHVKNVSGTKTQDGLSSVPSLAYTCLYLGMQRARQAFAMRCLAEATVENGSLSNVHPTLKRSLRADIKPSN